MRLSYLSIVATGLVYASHIVSAIPVGVESDDLSTTSHHSARKLDTSQITPTPNTPKTPSTKPKDGSGPKVASAASTQEKHPSLKPSSPRSQVYIDYISLERARLIRGAQPYLCPDKEEQHKTIIQDFLKLAATTLELVGDPPRYDFNDPTQCICFRDRSDILFDLSVDGVGGGLCKSGLHEYMCQGKVKSATEGELILPPHETVFQRP